MSRNQEIKNVEEKLLLERGRRLCHQFIITLIILFTILGILWFLWH